LSRGSKTKLTTMVSKGTETQQKIVSSPLIIHPSLCTQWVLVHSWPPGYSCLYL
jgi:hypothetical protein